LDRQKQNGRSIQELSTNKFVGIIRERLQAPPALGLKAARRCSFL